MIVLSIAGFEFMRHSAMKILTGVFTTPKYPCDRRHSGLHTFQDIYDFLGDLGEKPAKSIGSSALLADAQHHKSVAMLAVLVGVSGAIYPGIPILNPIAGIVVLRPS